MSVQRKSKAVAKPQPQLRGSIEANVVACKNVIEFATACPCCQSRIRGAIELKEPTGLVVVDAG